MRIYLHVGAAVLCIIAACSAKGTVDPNADPGADPAVAPAADPGDPTAPVVTPKPTTSDASTVPGATCDLAQSGLSFPGACQTCMQAKCCAESVACFVDNIDCRTLHTCLKLCPGDPDAGTAGDGGREGGGDGGGDGGGGGGDGGGGGKADAGLGANNPCKKTCYDAHPMSIVTEPAYDKCLLAGCKAECGG